MDDLREKTLGLYEVFRKDKMLGSARASTSSTSGSQKKGEPNGPLAIFEEEKRQHEQKMKKMEKDMKALFNQKVQEKEGKLNENETKVLLLLIIYYYFQKVQTQN